MVDVTVLAMAETGKIGRCSSSLDPHESDEAKDPNDKKEVDCRLIPAKQWAITPSNVHHHKTTYPKHRSGSVHPWLSHPVSTLSVVRKRLRHDERIENAAKTHAAIL
ncbi:hypothetical protein DOTSEDRAFT_32032 [Dothistroma septosporum NZE10]|uniref:Uncharacterized protein n=1 Tax=Dothistroma septosporum (strain NZE10 / CBS 128990) TaxID=675120 RepID=N1PXD2_DOTSN|nr:hypothetical protein DOTSEDRAFT_32032 [Dothistroma septosporum NZE10]